VRHLDTNDSSSFKIIFAILGAKTKDLLMVLVPVFFIFHGMNFLANNSDQIKSQEHFVIVFSKTETCFYR
jgi:hypothetical protein